jgi:hypothetical protein
MRQLMILALGVTALGGSAAAQDAPMTVDCKRTLAGGERCVSSAGHVTERTPLPGGGEKTTSTDPRMWGTSNGHRGGWTPPDAMMRYSPYMVGTRDRVTEPWEPRREARRETGIGVTLPDGRTTRCSTEGGGMRCRTR